ncbi:MAG: hypothetical protein JSR60_19535 [Proteobacteria bacterium]|nr:hypothetical protein [Pseudomonadota bacterium]
MPQAVDAQDCREVRREIWSCPQIFVLTARDAESSDGIHPEGNIYLS